MGIGEAAVTALNEKGIPTPLSAVLLCAPKSRMDILSDPEIKSLITSSRISGKYSEMIDRESAYEILNKKIEQFSTIEKQEEIKKSQKANEKSTFEKVLDDPLTRQVGRTVAREITRGRDLAREA